MNMISTGAFLNEMDASDKQKALIKKLTTAWEKKNAKAAKAGGASLLAISLAACGGGDENAEDSISLTQAAYDQALADAAAAVDTSVDDDDAILAAVQAVDADATTVQEVADNAAAAVDTSVDDDDAILAAVQAVDPDATTVQEVADNAAAGVDITSDNEPLEAQIADLQNQLDALQNPTPASDALTTAQNILSGTASNDAFTATSTTLTATDVISDTSSTDSDTLTVSLADGTNGTAPTSISGIENVVYNVTSFSAPTIDVANIVGASITVNHLQLAGATDITVNNLSVGSSLTAGSGVTGTVNVVTAEDAGAVINTGAATNLNVDVENGAIDDQSITVNVAGDLALDLEDGDASAGGDAGEITTLNLTASAASEVTLTGAEDLETLTGDANTTVLAAIDTFDGVAVSGAAGITGTVADADLSDVDAAVTITLSDGAGGGADITVADGASISIEEATQAIDFGALDDGDNDVDSEYTLNIALDGNVAGNIEVSDSTGGDAFTTVNVAANVDTGTFDLDLAPSAADIAVNVSGDADVGFSITSSGGGAVTVNAAAATGVLTGLSTATTLLSITTGAGGDTVAVAADDSVVSTGAGDDTLTLTSGDDVSVDAGDGDDTLNYTAGTGSYDGGDGTDTLVLGAAEDFTGSTLAGIEVITVDDATDFLASQLTGQTWVVTDAAAGSLNIDNANAVDVSTINLSGLTMSAATLETTTNLSNFDASIFLAAQNFTFIGSSVEDNVIVSGNDDDITTAGGADVVTGGAGDSTISLGAGADEFTSGAGDETVDLGAADGDADTVNFADGQGSDTITSFETTTDGLDFSGLTGITGITGTADNNVTTAAAADSITFGDDETSVITTDGSAADITTAGTATITDFTDAEEVAAYLEELIDFNGNAATTEVGVFVLVDETGGNSYAWLANDNGDGDNTDLTATDLSLLATLVDVEIVQGDIA